MRPPRKRHAAGGSRRRGDTTKDYSGSQILPPAGAESKRLVATVGLDRDTPEFVAAVFSDREWFAAHPDRRYRVRRVARGEHGDAQKDQPSPTHSVVEQLRAGLRRRVPVCFNDDAIRDLARIEIRADADAIIGNFVALLERDRVAYLRDAVELAYTGGTA